MLHPLQSHRHAPLALGEVLPESLTADVQQPDLCFARQAQQRHSSALGEVVAGLGDPIQAVQGTLK